jgi:hypothetical protein
MPDSWRRLSAHDEVGGSLGDPLLVDIRQIVDQAQSHSATGEPVAPTDGSTFETHVLCTPEVHDARLDCAVRCDL